MTDSATKPTTGRREEIEITPAMIEAGIVEMPALYSPRDDLEDALVRIYRAMETVRRTSLVASDASFASLDRPTD